MEQEYTRENKIVERTLEEKQTQLVKTLIKTRLELESANKNFEYADGELIDYYSYKIKAIKAKLDYVLKQIKKEGLIVDMIKQIEIQNLSEDDAV